MMSYKVKGIYLYMLYKGSSIKVMFSESVFEQYKTSKFCYNDWIFLANKVTSELVKVK